MAILCPDPHRGGLMSKPRSAYYAIEGHSQHVTHWGDPANPALVMWHGLARVGRDFDIIAARLADRYHVICPDTIGRGLSGWSPDPDADYTIPAYCRHAVLLLAELGISSCRWVGTSMGGLIGMALAGSAATRPLIERLVLNDIAPRLNQGAIDRIKAYVSMVPEFDNILDFEKFIRAVYAPFGIQDDAEWRHMAEISIRRRDNGKFSSHFDPAVMRVFVEQFDHFDAWDLYDAITCPVLTLRGAVSDLVEAGVAQEMTQRGPRTRLEIIDGCGHAPALNNDHQIGLITDFLN